MGRKLGDSASFGGGGAGLIVRFTYLLTYNVAWAEAYLHAKFHIDASNRLAIIHQRYRQTGQTDRQTDNGLIAQGEPSYKRSPKNESCLAVFALLVKRQHIIVEMISASQRRCSSMKQIYDDR